MQRLHVAVAFLLALSSLVLSQSSSGGTAAAQPTAPSVSPLHPKGDYVTVNGARLWYESEGSGEALVLISGGPGFSHDYFHPYFSVLRDSFRVIYFDAFGRGKSDRAKNRSEYTLARDVEDIEGLRRALNLGKINVLGHSYGGTLAQSYALRFPDSVRRLILVDSSFSGEMWQAANDNSNNELRNQFPETWEKIQQVREQGFNTCSKEYQDVSDFPPAFLMFYNASSFDKLIEGGGSLNNDVYCAIVGEDADFVVSGEIGKLDFRQDLRKLSMPMLILAGRFDRVVSPRWMVQYKRYAPQAQFVMFEKSGHFPFIEETDSAMRILRDFLHKQ
jgi:proline iminopeptidase